MILPLFRFAPGCVLLLGLIFPQAIHADELPLQISTESRVNGRGEVTVFLTLKNTGDKPLFQIHPMFHFHHTDAVVPMIPKLEPQQSMTLENNDHPAVMRAGRYPLVVMAHYKKDMDPLVFSTVLHTDSFYYQEPVESVVDGRLESSIEPSGSFLNVLLRNNSQALKNVRLLLLLPPGVIAESFKGMMGVTLQGGERKYFQVPVIKAGESMSGSYPVHLLIEYGEKLKHYSGEIRGKIEFDPEWNSQMLAFHMAVIAVMCLGLYWAYRKKWKELLNT